MNVALLTSERYREHKTDIRPGVTHPENEKRLIAIEETLRREGWFSKTVPVEPYEADDTLLRRVHSAKMIEGIQEACMSANRVSLDPDTVASLQSETVARLAVGGACAAAEKVVSGEAHRALCLVRPPGHHSMPTRTMGFCIYSNIALVAKWLQAERGVKRILIVDFDVHHGNGTQEVFYEDDSVFFLSTHQYPFYPGTGAASDRGRRAGEGTTRNLPFPAETDPATILDAVRGALEEIGPAFKPEFVLISAGFDGHKQDPLASWNLDESAYRELTSMVLAVADRYARGRVVSLLEGGYNLEALARSLLVHLHELSGSPSD